MSHIIHSHTQTHFQTSILWCHILQLIARCECWTSVNILSFPRVSTWKVEWLKLKGLSMSSPLSLLTHPSVSRPVPSGYRKYRQIRYMPAQYEIFKQFNRNPVIQKSQSNYFCYTCFKISLASVMSRNFFHCTVQSSISKTGKQISNSSEINML